MFKVTYFPKNRQDFEVLIVSPHSSEGKAFFEKFPQILEHPEISKHSELMNRYLRIEADRGASELSLSLAQFLEAKGIAAMVLELDYPRGIVDGGRILDHCLRSCLPLDISDFLEDEFRKMHQSSLKQLKHFHDEINERGGLVIDMHTMASYSPMQEGVEKTERESFESLERYCQQFIEAPKTEENLRQFDVITEDGEGNLIADPVLREELINLLFEHNIPYKENHPYFAYPAFLMNTHLTRCPAIAIDIPKHFIATTDGPEDFDLENFKISQEKVDSLSSLIALAIERTLMAKKV